jgi:hypothetical protein
MITELPAADQKSGSGSGWGLTQKSGSLSGSGFFGVGVEVVEPRYNSNLYLPSNLPIIIPCNLLCTAESSTRYSPVHAGIKKTSLHGIVSCVSSAMY